MRDVRIVSYAALEPSRRNREQDTVAMVATVVREVLNNSGLSRKDIGFWCAGSCDYLEGSPFAFVGSLDAIGAWPPISESHVEMDGAFALYEAWVHLQLGHVDTALVFAFGRSSAGDLSAVLGHRMDPYLVSPLGIDAVAMAGLQAQAMRDLGMDVPLPTSLKAWDGAAAIVLSTTGAGAAITGIDHRIEPHALGVRDLTRSASTALAARKAGVRGDEPAFVSAVFEHEVPLLKQALGVSEVHAPPEAPCMVTGLMRLGQAFEAIADGADAAVAHASSGACLQHNLVARLEARNG